MKSYKKKTFIITAILILGVIIVLTLRLIIKQPINITFPAYQVENPQNKDYINTINNVAKFSVHVDLPNKWVIETEKGDANLPLGEFYTPLYIYEANQLIGYIGFNIFEPFTEEIPKEQYYKTVWPTLRLSSMFMWEPFTSIKATETGEVGIADISYKDPTKIGTPNISMAEIQNLETIGILAYDKKLKVYIGMAFIPDIITRDKVISIAKSINIYADN
jgi:hypothetical protein